ncbi:MAG: hypothetical protein IKW47_05475, partial [Alistipes sp.]|nr:hypothetical protein [Alistipes sp.]
MNDISIVQKKGSEFGRLVYYGEAGETGETGAIPSLNPHQHASQTPHISPISIQISLYRHSS